MSSHRVPPRWVVKLGGSLHDAECLPGWLSALADAQAILAPGGGPFADAVRASQASWRFSDAAAHAMAILAMRQYGLMLADLCPDLSACADIHALAERSKAGRATIWLPDPAAIPSDEVPASWEVTSDSLAAWLARKLGADHLLLVKSAEIPAGELTAGQAVSEAWVDPAFPEFLAQSRLNAWLCRREHHARLREGLRDPEAVFTRLIPNNDPFINSAR